MEDINNKAYDDELNKSQDSIEDSPRKFIPVPKKNKKDDRKNVVR